MGRFLVLLLLLVSTSAVARPRSCADRALRALGIPLEQRTDPDLLRQILAEDLLLDRFRPLLDRLGPALREPQPLGPMLRAIRDSVDQRQPAVSALLCAAVREDLLPDPRGAEAVITRALHHTWLLDRITREMGQDLAFRAALMEHLRAERVALGIRPQPPGAALDLIRVTGSLFATEKALTMDYTMVLDAELKARGVVSPAALALQQQGIAVHILEASFTERAHGYVLNARVGAILASRTADAIRVRGAPPQLDYVLPPGWAALYESWNLAFLTGNMDNLDLLYPKLLAPAVLGAPDDRYVATRNDALWVSINAYLFRKARRRPDTHLPGAAALARRWGQINWEAALAYLQARGAAR